MECSKCETESEFRHLHNEAHGLAGTHMAGSERFECKSCGYSVYKVEGEKLGFKFIAD